MPLRLDVKRKISARSDRVKSVDLHPTEPWILAALYNGHVHIWSYQTQTLLKQFEVSGELPVRSVKWVARKQWFITGSDDMLVRVYNYNTMEKVQVFEAHSDYIRSVAVHPSAPFVLTSSDDMLIKLWDWDKKWANTMVFEGHTHYVMMVIFNPKDPNTFASASLDRSIKVWGLQSAQPHFTLEGHEKGVNCLDYFTGGEKPYLLSGADDKTCRIWDYQSRTCVQVLDGHQHNVTTATFHPDLPIIFTGSEDGSVRIWHTNTYRLENTLNYGMERVWSIAVLKGTQKVGLGYDEVMVLIKIGKEAPVASMDNGGKIIWSRHNEIQTVNVKTATEVVDGERLPLATKELGSCEIYPQSLKHAPNGRLVCVCGDGEFIIYTALQWRNKSYGSALEFVWTDSGDYATRESGSKIKTFKNFKEKNAFTPPYNTEGIYGGPCLGIRSADFICFYDWEECRLIRRIDVVPKQVIWSEDGTLVVIASDSSFYILKYSAVAAAAYFDSPEAQEESGSEEAFELLHEVSERVRTGLWLGDCFVYTNGIGRLNYCVGGEVQVLHHLDRRMYLLGYIPKDNRLYLIDKEHNIVSFELLLSILEYKTAVVRRDLEAATSALATIPTEHHNNIARFLDTQGLKEEAVRLATDADYKFELALQLGKLDLAFQIVSECESEQKWKQLGDLATNEMELDLAEKCMIAGKDLAGLLLLYSSTASREGFEKLARMAQEDGKANVAFIALFLLGKIEECVDLLVGSGRVPEAAFLCRTYLPSKVSSIVEVWKADLEKVNKKAADSLADPAEYPNLFPDITLAIQAEGAMKAVREKKMPAHAYNDLKERLNAELIEEVRNGELQVSAVPASPPKAAPKEPEPAPAEPAPVVEAEPPAPKAEPAVAKESPKKKGGKKEKKSEPAPEPTPEPEPEPPKEEPAAAEDDEGGVDALAAELERELEMDD